jgi:hypothetical protein
MLLIASSTFWPSAHAENHEERDRGRLAVEPHANDGAVQDQPRDRLLGQRTAIPGISGALHPPSPCARSGSPCPCLPFRQTRPRAPDAPAWYWCRLNSCLRSVRRRQACGAIEAASARNTADHFNLRKRLGHRRMPRAILAKLGPPAKAGVRSKRGAVQSVRRAPVDITISRHSRLILQLQLDVRYGV